MASTAARPYHHGNLRAALLEEAERALARDGVQGLSLRELARGLGVSHAAPRRHFADRQALFTALAESGFGRLGRELDAALAAAGPEFSERLAAVAGAYVRFATEHAALLELMFVAKHGPGAEFLHELATQAFAAPMTVIAQGQAAGDVVAGDLERIGVLTWATMHGLAGMINSGLVFDAPLPELVAEAVDRLVAGLAPR